MTAIAPTEGLPEARVNLSANAMVVGMLQSALSNLDTNLAVVPDLLIELDHGDCWRVFKFADQRKETRWKPRQFREFIEAPRPDGCETSIAVLEQALRGTAAWETFLRLTRDEHGGSRNPFGRSGKPEEINRDNVTVDSSEPEPPATLPFSPGKPRDYTREAPTGNSTSYALRRLSKDAPELLERVRAGELSPNAAMVRAGLRKPHLQVKDDPEALAAYLLRKWDRERIAALLRSLAEAMTD